MSSFKQLEDKFVDGLLRVAQNKGCKPLTLGWLSILDQPDEATLFWKRLSDFCSHNKDFKGNIEQALRHEFRKRHSYE